MFPYNIYLGLCSCLETKKKWVKLTREHKIIRKVLCALQNTSVYRDFACIFMALNENKSQNLRIKLQINWYFQQLENQWAKLTRNIIQGLKLYLYICVCVCVCVCTKIIYWSVCVCVCGVVCVCVCVCGCCA